MMDLHTVNAIEDASQLRRTVRDLLALSTLPAVWSGYGPDGIALSLADVLLTTLSLDLIYIRLQGRAEGDVVEIARSSFRPDAVSQAKVIGQALAPYFNTDICDPIPSIPDLFGSGPLRVAITRFGHTGENGIMIAGSRRLDFPAERDRLLLSFGANQTFIVIQRKRAERSMAEQRELLRVTLASIGDAVITTDIEGRISYLNAVAESVTGWTNKDAAGQSLNSLFRIVNEHSCVPVENPATKALKEGVIAGLANHSALIGKDDKKRPIDGHAAPIRGEQGKVDGVVLTFRDISERRRSEKEHAERVSTARFLASIVESSNDAIISKSLDGIIQSWNFAAQRLFGYSEEQAIGRHISLLIPSDRAEEEEKIIASLRAGERVDHFDTVRLRSDGQPIHVSLTISPIKNEAGEVVGASKIARDITEQKEAEKRIYNLMAELKEVDQRKDEFLATLAHELRGPLAPLRNILEILKRADGIGGLLQQTRDTMDRQLGQMVRIVDDLLDVSRISRNKLELRKERVELAPILHQSVEACRPLADFAHHELIVCLPQEPIYLHADPVRLAQVFSNLLNNSCKYTEQGGKIWLAAERQGSDVLVKVKDTGIGIPADKLSSVFEMFSQVQSALERSQGGLGIGLTLVKRLVKMHEGTIEVTSEGSGMGSEFVVRLPCLIEKTKPSNLEPKTSQIPVAARRILVVDDNRDSAKSLAMLLKITGNETHLAHDGLEALEIAERVQPDVVLLDIGLPKLNGHDAARRIREKPWGKSMVLVALTGWGQEEDRRLSKDAGFDHHMVKPVEYAALMELLAGQGRSLI